MENYDKTVLQLCIPVVHPKEEKHFEVRNMYNPIIACKLKEKDSQSKIVYNDFSFDADGRIYILTGPNRGGKSVMLGAVGLVQVMFQLGLPVAAESAALSPVDHIFTHFAASTNSTLGMGKLGEE